MHLWVDRMNGDYKRVRDDVRYSDDTDDDWFDDIPKLVIHGVRFFERYVTKRSDVDTIDTRKPTMYIKYLNNYTPFNVVAELWLSFRFHNSVRLTVYGLNM